MPKKLSYESVKNFIRGQGYVLLSDEYKDNKTKIRLRCPEGHVFEVRFDNFKGNSSRCPICKGMKSSQRQKYSINYVKECFKERNYELLSEIYINNRQKLRVKCTEGHIFDMPFGEFLAGHGCSECYGNKRHDYEYVKSYVEGRGYEMLSYNYVNSKTKIKLQCCKGHIFDMRFNNFQNEQGCPVCWYQTCSSKAEKEIFHFIDENVNTDVIPNDRTQIINPLTNEFLELDIWIPEFKKAVEFNGSYWHSSNYSKTKDKIKKEQCLAKGIDLLVIKEQDWLTNKEKCVRILENFLKERG